VHRASPTLLILATCLAGSLMSAAPAAAEDSGPSSSASPTQDPSPSVDDLPGPVLLSPSPSAPADEVSPSPEPDPTEPSPSATAEDVLLSVNVAMPATAAAGPSSAGLPRARLPLRTGHYGLKVARVQERLTWLGYDISASNTSRQAFGRSTRDAVKAFQSKNSLALTGKVTKMTWRKLRKQAEPLGILPLRCTEVKTALCIDKTTRTLRLVVKGKVMLVTDARFGAPGMETGEGVFTVKEKSYNHTSSLYRTWMPRAMFFNGDEAVHYSPDFASVGYLRGSHGCVGVRDLDVATRLFEKVDVGTRVYVYWS